MSNQEEFEKTLFNLTKPINGQYPRPWMTDLTNPFDAKVFIVGHNPATEFKVADIESHSTFMDALYNRNGQSCLGLYNKITGAKPSKSRENIENLSNMLKKKEVTGLIETNVVCYSTSTSGDLHKKTNSEGLRIGETIFKTIVSTIKPPVIIIHGAGTKKAFEKNMKCKLPPCPESRNDIIKIKVFIPTYSTTIYIIPSLALPAYNTWKNFSEWANEYLEKVTDHISQTI